MMRPALACLTATLLAASGTAALAQTAPETPPTMTSPAPAEAAAPAAQAPAPATGPAATAPAPAAGAAAPAASNNPAADPAVAAAPVAPPPMEAQYVLQALEQVCRPLIAQADLKKTTKAGGFKSSRGMYTMKLEGGKTITLRPPSVANPRTCELQVTFDTGGWRPMVETINAWAYRQNPQLPSLYQGFVPLDGKSTTWSWSQGNPDGTVARGLAFNVVSAGKFDQGNLIYTDNVAAATGG